MDNSETSNLFSTFIPTTNYVLGKTSNCSDSFRFIWCTYNSRVSTYVFNNYSLIKEYVKMFKRDKDGQNHT